VPWGDVVDAALVPPNERTRPQLVLELSACGRLACCTEWEKTEFARVAATQAFDTREVVRRKSLCSVACAQRWTASQTRDWMEFTASQPEELKLRSGLQVVKEGRPDESFRLVLRGGFKKSSLHSMAHDTDDESQVIGIRSFWGSELMDGGTLSRYTVTCARAGALLTLSGSDYRCGRRLNVSVCQYPPSLALPLILAWYCCCSFVGNAPDQVQPTCLLCEERSLGCWDLSGGIGDTLTVWMQNCAGIIRMACCQGSPSLQLAAVECLLHCMLLKNNAGLRSAQPVPAPCTSATSSYSVAKQCHILSISSVCMLRCAHLTLT
jgi:hypothetical protein